MSKVLLCSDCGTEDCVKGEIMCFTAKTATIIEVDKYCPSNGTEGMIFLDKFCDRCQRQPEDPDDGGCEILMRTMIYNVDDDKFPSEWHYDFDEKPTCSKFMERENG